MLPYSVDPDAVGSVTQTLLGARGRGSNVFVVGNADSAAMASHTATDIMQGSGLVDPPLRVIALTDNQSVITASGSSTCFQDLHFLPQIPDLMLCGGKFDAITITGTTCWFLINTLLMLPSVQSGLSDPKTARNIKHGASLIKYGQR